MPITNSQHLYLKNLGGVFQNLAYVFTGNAFSGIINSISLIWFARVLGTKVMGDYAAIVVGIQLVTSIMIPGFNQAVIREPARQELTAAAIIATMFQSCLLLVVGSVIGLYMYWQDEETSLGSILPIFLLLLCLVLSFWVYLLSVPFEASMKYEVLVKVRIISSIGGIIAGLAAAQAGQGIYALIMRDLVFSVSSVGLLRMYSPLPFVLHEWRKGMESLLAFTRGLWGLNAMEKVALRIDYALVGFLIGKDELGIYYTIRGLVEGLIGFVVSPIQTVVYSFYCRLHDVSELVNHLLDKGIIMAFVGAALTIPSIFVLGPSIVSVLLGEAYGDGNNLLPGFVLYAFGLIWFENIKTLAVSQNLHHSMQLARLTQLVISLALIFPFVRLFGLGGAGTSAGIASICMAIVSTRQLLLWPVHPTSNRPTYSITKISLGQ